VFRDATQRGTWVILFSGKTCSNVTSVTGYFHSQFKPYDMSNCALHFIWTHIASRREVTPCGRKWFYWNVTPIIRPKKDAYASESII